MKIFKIFDVLTGSPRVPGQNKNHTLSPTDFGIWDKHGPLWLSLVFKASPLLFPPQTFMFSSLFDPEKLFREKLTGLVGVFFHAELPNHLFPEFSDQVHTWQSTSAASLWHHLRLVELDSWNKSYFCLSDLKYEASEPHSDSTGNISWLQPPSSHPHYPSLLRHPEVH